MGKVQNDPVNSSSIEEERLAAADETKPDVIEWANIWPLIEWVFFVPGDAVFLGLMVALPGVATFFEITPTSFGGGNCVALILGQRAVLCGGGLGNDKGR